VKYAKNACDDGRKIYYDRQVDPNDVLVVPDLIQNAVPDYSGQGGVSPRSQTDPDVPAPDLSDVVFGGNWRRSQRNRKGNHISSVTRVFTVECIRQFVDEGFTWVVTKIEASGFHTAAVAPRCL
jgi:hypothetical protein